MSLKLSLTTTDPLRAAVDVAVIGVVEGASPRAGALAVLSKDLGPVVARSLKREEFTGKKDQMLELPTLGKLKPSKVVLMGLGSTQLTEANVRTLAAKAARLAQNARATTLALMGASSPLPTPLSWRGGAPPRAWSRFWSLIPPSSGKRPGRASRSARASPRASRSRAIS